MVSPAFYSGTGRRKTAIARVRLLPGEGEIVVNGRSLEEHFGNAINESDVRMPFRVTGTEGHFNALVKVEGGGVSGQAGAIRHGIARALLQFDAEANRLPLRQAGFLTADPLVEFDVALSQAPTDEPALLGRTEALGALLRRGEAAATLDRLAEIQE